MSKQAALGALFQSLQQQQQKVVDLMESNDYLEAFSVLQSTIQSKRQKQNYPILQDLGRRILDCAFELHSFTSLKQVLTHLRNVCQHQSPQTIKKVFEYFRRKLSDLAENTLKSGDLDDIEDIERDKIPQQIIALSFDLSSSMMENSPADRGKMILQGYKMILEILRNNTQMLQSYNITAVQALEFCQNHKRRSEFKRLSDLLRAHLQQIVENEKKTSDQLRNVPHPMRLTDTQTTQFVLDLREKQLEVAMRLQLTKDAYNVIQDINFLLTRIGKKLEKRKLRDYLGMVGKVFLDAGYYLYFAEAVMQQLQITLVKDLSASAEERRIAAELAVVATLAIQRKNEANSFQKIGFISNKNLEYLTAETSYKKNSGLIGSERQPTRSSLLRDIINHHVLSLCGEEIRQLFNLLHNQMIKPIQISQFAPSVISYLSKNELTSYLVHPIRNQLILQILTILSKSYSSLHLKTIRKLTNFSTFDQALHVISKANRQTLLVCNIELNFKKEAVYFRSQQKKATSSNTNEFIDFLTKIQSTRALIDKRQYAGINQDSRKRAIKKAAENIEEDKQSIRQAKIKKRKQGQQHQLHIKSMNEEMEKNKKQIQQQEAMIKQEEQRIESQMAHLRKLMMIKEQIKKNQRVECIKELKARGTKFNENAEMDVLLQEIQKIEDKEKQNLRNISLKLFKHTNYFEIARRKAEKKKLEDQINQNEKGRTQKIMQHFEKKHQVDLQLKKKFQIFKSYKRQYFKDVDAVREAEFQKSKEAYNVKMIQKVKLAIIEKAQQAKEAVDRKKRKLQAEKKRQATMKDALQAKAARDSEKPAKRSAFGTGMKEVASTNEGFKRGTQIKKQNLESFGFGQGMFSFTNSSKKADDSWKKNPGGKQPHKPAMTTKTTTTAATGQKKFVKESLDLPPPRQEPAKKFDSKFGSGSTKFQDSPKKPPVKDIDMDVFKNYSFNFKGTAKEDRKDPTKAKAQIEASKDIKKELPPKTTTTSTTKPPSKPPTAAKRPPYQDHKHKKIMSKFSDSDSDDQGNVDDQGFTIVSGGKKKNK